MQLTIARRTPLEPAAGYARNESLTSVRDAAKSLMTGLGTLQGLYLAILGFAKFVPPEARIEVKVLFMAPLLFWMFALYNCLQVMMTRTFDINLNSPTEIRDHTIARVKNKQRFLTRAFAFLVAGLLAAMLLVILAWQHETLLSPTR